MKKIFTRRGAIIAACIVLAMAVVLLLPLTRVSASPSTLSACINPGNGMMRLVSDSSQCHANENFVTWNVTGPAGPAGPAGPQGPAGPSGGGAPFVVVCTPANFQHGGNDPAVDLSVFNAGTSTANIAVNFLDATNNNLAGVAIPGAQSGQPQTYPGDSGSSTETLAVGNTKVFHSLLPETDLNTGSFVASIRVTSDQPVAVGMSYIANSFFIVPCTPLSH